VIQIAMLQAMLKAIQEVTVLHQMLLAAMRCKQTTDPAHVATLRSLLKKFEALYFGSGGN